MNDLLKRLDELVPDIEGLAKDIRLDSRHYPHPVLAFGMLRDPRGRGEEMQGLP